LPVYKKNDIVTYCADGCTVISNDVE